MSYKIAASILSADFARLGEQVQEAIDAGVDYIHVDVMDGHYVPNITLGPLVVSAIQPITRAGGVIMDVHLMIDTPERMIPQFAKANPDLITVHVETCKHLYRVLQHIKELGLKVGVTLNPSTPLVALEEVLGEVDLVLLMTVNPGFGGQSFIPTMFDKITRLRRMLDERGLQRVDIQIDGGVKASNAAQIAAAGASILVAGSAIFNSERSVAENVAALRNSKL